jgi:hypothetical protein
MVAGHLRELPVEEPNAIGELTLMGGLSVIVETISAVEFDDMMNVIL